MSLWQSSPAVEPGEHVVLDVAGNDTRPGRSVGGRVTVTDRRVLFTPNKLDALLGAGPFAIDRATVDRAWVERPRRRRRPGVAAGWRRQVGIEHPGGPSFVLVSRPDDLVAALQ